MSQESCTVVSLWRYQVKIDKEVFDLVQKYGDTEEMPDKIKQLLKDVLDHVVTDADTYFLMDDNKKVFRAAKKSDLEARREELGL